MLAMFRRFLNTWAARAFFIVLIGSFGLWGVSGVIQDISTDNAVAQVGGKRIEPQEFQEQFRRGIAQVSRMLGGRTEPTPAIRRAVAGQTLERLVVQAAIDEQVSLLGIAVPQDDVKRAVFDIPAFHGPGGSFSKTTFDSVMRSNNLTEARFLDQVRANLAQGQLMESVSAGAASPDVLTQTVFAFQRETRVAEYVELPFAAAAEPPAPTDADLQRHYDNNQATFSAAEYRRIKAVVLSADTIARATDVGDDEVQAYYDQHRTDYVTAEKRSVQVIVAADQPRAAALATAWIAGASWDDMQKQAEPGASTVVLDDSTQPEFPSPELGAAVFAAAPDAVTGPVGSPLGWQVFRVTKVTPGASTTLADASAAIRTRIAGERAADAVYERANRLEDALSASPTLDEIPADLGAAAIAGTLDVRGNTQSGEPAPIPGTPTQRQAIITAAFALQKGEPPRMTEGPENSYFAVVVEDTTPAAPKPYAEVADQVREDWLRDARRKTQEAAAASLFAAAKAGGSLDDAAVVAGLRLQRTPPLSRSTPTPGVARELADAAFKLKLHEPTMIEVPDAFLVAAPAEISAPNAAADPLGAGQTRRAMVEAVGQDLQNLYATALRSRLRPTVNQRVIDSIVNPPS